MRNLLFWKRPEIGEEVAQDQKRSHETSHVRSNHSTAARWTEPRVPFAKGKFKKAYRGHYTDGPRKGQECVYKAFKRRPLGIHRKTDIKLFRDEAIVLGRTKEVIKDWNDAGIINLPIVLSVPEVWVIGTKADSVRECLVEPFIQGFQKFNDRRGRARSHDDFWSEALQALSHFSYHRSSGSIVLCDIQGGIYEDNFILSDPAILSPAKSYGVTDLGASGIDEFFARHKCNRFCDQAWIKPGPEGLAVWLRDTAEKHIHRGIAQHHAHEPQ